MSLFSVISCCCVNDKVRDFLFSLNRNGSFEYPFAIVIVCCDCDCMFCMCKILSCRSFLLCFFAVLMNLCSVQKYFVENFCLGDLCQSIGFFGDNHCFVVDFDESILHLPNIVFGFH